MIWRRQWAEPPTLLATLRTEILRRAATEPSYHSRNVGGWRSPDDFLDWPLDAIGTIRARIASAIAEVQVVPRARSLAYRAWAVVNRAGSFHRRHQHSESVWSGIYYVDPGGAPSARTLFEVGAETVYVTPRAGLITVFPAATWHSVEPHRGDGSRITIAFDAQ